MRDITKPVPSWKYLNPLDIWAGLWKNRELIGQLLRRNIEARYKGSAMGLFWLVATPLAMLAVYTFVFGFVYGARWGQDLGGSRAAFPLMILCGMAVFNIFSESVNKAAKIITGNVNFVKKAVFPLEALPVASVLSTCFFGLVWFVILLGGVAFFLHRVSLSAVCLPLVLIPLVLSSCGLAWFVASLGVFIRDLSHGMEIFLRALFFMTPVCYSLEMVPVRFRDFLALNPLAVIVEAVRRSLMYGEWPDWTLLGTLTVFSAVIFQMGYFWFMKTKKGFADVL